MGITLATAQRAQGVAEAAITAEGFDAIMRQHQRRVYRVILLLVREPDAADQLTQECFLRAYRKRKSFRGESSVETWLLRIAVNLAKDHGKNRRASFWRHLVRLDEPERDGKISPAQRMAWPGASPERELLAREELDAVWSALEMLSEQQRAVFLLRFGDEMALEEVGCVLGIKVGTVKAQLARATGKIRQILQERQKR